MAIQGSEKLNPLGLLVVATGLFSIAGAVFNWDWYMNHYKARFIVKILGRIGARLLHGLFGGGLAIVGLLMTMGIIHDSN